MNHHYFASSVANWAATTEERTLQDLINLMVGHGDSFSLFYVPVSPDTQYEINFFTPQVEGTKFVEFFDKAKFKKKRVKK
jgi:hypothetical protein